MNSMIKNSNCDNKIYLDRIRVIASIFVVTIHVSAQFINDNLINFSAYKISEFYNFLAQTAVPLFIFISGAIYLNENKCVTYKKIFLSILRFIIMFFVWDFIYLFFDYLLIKNKPLSLLGLIHILETLTDYKYHLWYLLSYIILLALVPILKLICKKENKSQVKYLLIIFLICTCSIDFLKHIVTLINSSHIILKGIKYLFTLIDLINFGKLNNLPVLFISGWYFSTFDFENKRKHILILKWFIGIGVPILSIISEYNLISNYFFLPNYLLTICIFLTFRYSKIANKPNKLLDFVGKHTLGIYLIHVLIIDLIVKYANVILADYYNSLLFILIIPMFILITYLLSITFAVIFDLLPKKIRKWIC